MFYMEQPEKKLGRPSKFTDAICEKILDLAKLGKTDTEIARSVGISTRTLNYWKVKNPEFLQSLRDEKDVSNQFVVASLFQRACGYSHVAVKMFYDKDRGVVIKERYIEHYPPDVTAAIFWLKNRDPSGWQDKPESSNDDVEIPQPLYAVVTSKPDATSA